MYKSMEDNRIQPNTIDIQNETSFLSIKTSTISTALKYPKLI